MIREQPQGAQENSRDLPLDAHVHTDLSPDSDVPIDVYAALAVERGIRELAITDHVDFDARDPAYDYTSFEQRERTVRDAAERWAPKGVLIRFGAELTYNRSWEGDLRAHLARHRYDFTIGSVHDWPDSPYVPGRVRTWATGRPLDEVLAPYLAEIAAAAGSGLFDTIGHLDVVRRYLHAHVTAGEIFSAVELFEPALRALVDSGTALEVNSSGYRQPSAEAYPGPPLIERYRELGGRHVTSGSDSHRAHHFAWGLEAGYRLLAAAGFTGLAFRRGGDRVGIPIPDRLRGPAPAAASPNIRRGGSL
ncbi:MAG TPA: histidinol-phosphatase HisJ family protein [Candidatus Sulfomarinibacteraceae bacterium]|nr:histidinol-phosphatase HisJ family protein [Candidatus Sulfomarinibacteraceae bacterium]